MAKKDKEVDLRVPIPIRRDRPRSTAPEPESSAETLDTVRITPSHMDELLRESGTDVTAAEMKALSNPAPKIEIPPPRPGPTSKLWPWILVASALIWLGGYVLGLW